GIGPVIAWRRATWANARRNLLAPTAAALAVFAALLAFGVTRSATSLAMFVFATFAVAVVIQEFAPRAAAPRAVAPEEPRGGVAGRRYGGYTVPLGMAVRFVGVAASTAFQHARDVRLTPGRTATVGGYQVKYVRATARPVYRGDRLERVALGAVLDVRKDGRH